MIKVFTTNKNGKIELTKEELKSLMDEAYWEGYKANCVTYTYHTPNWSPYVFNSTTSGTSITLNGESITNGTINASDSQANTVEVRANGVSQ